MQNKRIMILGGTGTLGVALINRLRQDNTLYVFSRDEAKHWTLKNEIPSPNLKFAVGDIRDYQRVAECLIKFKPNIVIIAAALKQVDTCELSPYESIQTNITGIKNTIDAIEHNLPTLKDSLESVMLVSTDKACAPVNVYGMCKAIAERVITSRSVECEEDVRFVCVRYGNVLDSRGSILPLFRWQAAHAEAFTLTHPGMTRFLMTLDDSVQLIVHALEHARSGEIWIPKLRAMSISDLAEIFAERFEKPVRTIGMRPGEKLHEALICEPESLRARDVGSHYVLDPIHTEVSPDAHLFEYTSADDVLSREELAAFFDSINVFGRDMADFVGKHIEEIRTLN